MTIPKSRYIRYTTLSIVLGLVIYLALGYGSRSFEDYCPFGGAESLWGLFTAGEFSCALGPLNLSLMLALIGLVILSKKSFCGWACPIGFLERIGRPLRRAGLEKTPTPQPFRKQIPETSPLPRPGPRSLFYFPNRRTDPPRLRSLLPYLLGIWTRQPRNYLRDRPDNHCPCRLCRSDVILSLFMPHGCDLRSLQPHRLYQNRPRPIQMHFLRPLQRSLHV